MNCFKKFVWVNGNILIILILGLTPLFWFKDGYLIIPGECSIPLDPINTFKTFLYAWYPYIQSGQPNQMVAAISPWYGFWAFFRLIGFSLQNIGRLWFIFVFALAGLSMHYLASTVLEKGKRNVAVLVASIFYMFNAYVMVMTPLRATPLAYAVIPLMLALYIKGLRDGRSGTKYAILIGIASAGMASTVMNPPIYTIPWVVIFFYSIYHLAVEGKKGASQLLFFVPKVIAVYFLVNLWWLYPYLAVALSQYGAIVEILRPRAMSSTFVEVFRLLGWWAFYESFGDGISYVPFAHYYKTPFLVVITFVVPVLAFSAAFFRSKSRYIPFFLGLGAVGIFLAHGAGESLPGSIFNFMYEHIPGFLIFREPFAKFTAITAVSYAILIGFTAESVYRWLTLRGKTIKRKVKRASHYISAYAFAIFVILTILVSSWPLLTGDIIFGMRGVGTSYIKIPDYWFETGEYLDAKDEDFKILILPSNGITSAGLPYIWGYGAQDLTPYLVHKPLITSNIGLGSWQPTLYSDKVVVDTFYDEFHSHSALNFDFQPMIQLLNIQYVLQRNDVNWEFAASSNASLYSPEHIKSVLDAQEDIHLEKSFGELDLYKISDEYFLPHIYSSTTSTLVNGDLEALVPLTETKYLGGKRKTGNPEGQAYGAGGKWNKPVLLFAEQMREEEKTGKGEGKEEQEITFKKINPTKYLVKVEGAKVPFWLVFSESFHKQWRIYNKAEVKEEVEGKRKVKVEEEFGEIVADYPKLKVKEAKHLIKFTPQDIKYLFRKPLNAKHQLVNGYANGWYVEPSKLGFGEDFTLVLYFWPQSLFYLGLGISGLTLFFCIGYLGFSFVKRKNGKIASLSVRNDKKGVLDETKN